ncbi:major Facilitator Superfamily protein [Mycobacterium kansasii]|uniref:Major Facilitator Superfamily protein n=1 Tax=Mycobacterium kansasii TaxID=1768 RepID=A0A1V3WYM9_MYCKA|nr:major Facilitator Superfamily protein [Mycobacterium kansasii]
MGLGSIAAGWLTASVQIGFAAGAVASALLTLADRIRRQRLVAAGAGCAAVCTAVLACGAHGLGEAIPLRFVTGFALAGVYPVGMKLMATWSESAARGRSFGVLIGALTLGSALPHLINGLGPLPWRAVLGIAAALCAVAAVIALAALVPGPHLDGRLIRPSPRYALAMFADRGVRLTNVGYFGHMWELYALWTWLAIFLMAGNRRDATVAGGIAFVAIGVAGAAGRSLADGRPTASAAGRRPWRTRRQRILLPGLTAVLHRADPGAGRVPGGVGCLGDRRLRGLRHLAERHRAQEPRRYRTDRTDCHRLSVDRGGDPPGPARRPARRLAVCVPGARPRSGDRCSCNVRIACPSPH